MYKLELPGTVGQAAESAPPVPAHAGAQVITLTTIGLGDLCPQTTLGSYWCAEQSLCIRDGRVPGGTRKSFCNSVNTFWLW